MNGELEQAELFALFWSRPPRPFRLRVNDLIRVNGKLGRVIRVTECAAVVLVNRSRRVFATRFDKPVSFQPSPATIRISPNSAMEILNPRLAKRKRHANGARRFA